MEFDGLMIGGQEPIEIDENHPLFQMLMGQLQISENERFCKFRLLAYDDQITEDTTFEDENALYLPEEPGFQPSFYRRVLTEFLDLVPANYFDVLGVEPPALFSEEQIEKFAREECMVHFPQGIVICLADIALPIVNDLTADFEPTEETESVMEIVWKPASVDQAMFESVKESFDTMTMGQAVQLSQLMLQQEQLGHILPDYNILRLRATMPAVSIAEQPVSRTFLVPDTLKYDVLLTVLSVIFNIEQDYEFVSLPSFSTEARLTEVFANDGDAIDISFEAWTIHIERSSCVTSDECEHANPFMVLDGNLMAPIYECQSPEAYLQLCTNILTGQRRSETNLFLEELGFGGFDPCMLYDPEMDTQSVQYVLSSQQLPETDTRDGKFEA